MNGLGIHTPHLTSAFEIAPNLDRNHTPNATPNAAPNAAPNHIVNYPNSCPKCYPKWCPKCCPKSQKSSAPNHAQHLRTTAKNNENNIFWTTLWGSLLTGTWHYQISILGNRPYDLGHALGFPSQAFGTHLGHIWGTGHSNLGPFRAIYVIFDTVWRPGIPSYLRQAMSISTKHH